MTVARLHSLQSWDAALASLTLLLGCGVDPIATHQPDAGHPYDAGIPNDGDADVTCTVSGTCQDPSAPRCDQGACVPCQTSADCEQFANARVCGESGACVQCSASEAQACEGTANPVCAPELAQCVACNADPDCTDPAAATCDVATHTCKPCETNDQCAHFDDAKLCNAGACVECTPETEAEDCGDNACDPVTFECTATKRASLESCEPCRSDSECIDGFSCIPVPYAGEEHGFYCMQALAAGACPRPYRTKTRAVSRNGRPSAEYCIHATADASCESIRTYDKRDCTVETAEAVCGLGGRCETVVGTANRCTYTCSEELFCPNSITCGAPPNVTKYCGG